VSRIKRAIVPRRELSRGPFWRKSHLAMRSSPADKIPCSYARIPCSTKIIPCSFEQGNSQRKPCNDVIIYSLWRSRNREFAKFPVKFPVSRETGQSRGPSALLRQPASPGSRDFHLNLARKPAVRWLVALRAESLRAEFDKFSARGPGSLRPCSALFPFSGETSRRLGSIALHCRVSSLNETAESATIQ
jgi:hypothetical protein